MTHKSRLNQLQSALQKRHEALSKLMSRKPSPATAKASKQEPPALPETVAEQSEPAPVVPRVKEAMIPLYADDAKTQSAPSAALLSLADLYLHAAQHRTRHIALLWPASLRSLTLVHALATTTRWREGDKQGIRGLTYPVKSNVFHGLNHIQFDRQSVLAIASDLVEVGENAKVKRSFPEKDPFLFSLTNQSLPNDPDEPFNPTIGEILPCFLGQPQFERWESCESRLLSLIRAKLSRRAHAKALQSNCATLGCPDSAPDAIFALDGRMSEDEVRQACRALAKSKPPEAIILLATRAVRMEAPAWRKKLARFALMLEEVFRENPPGVLIVTDDPVSAYRLKNELWELNNKRDQGQRWKKPFEFRISGVPSAVGSNGLLPPGAKESLHPAPREFDVHIVDSDAAKISNKLLKISNCQPGGKDHAKPIVEAATYISRLAALPCGVRHMSNYLAGPDVSNRSRANFDWPGHYGAVLEFERTIGVGENRQALQDAMKRGSDLFGNYHEATPFAHKLASVVANAAAGKRKNVGVIFTSALYRRLAERFFEEYRDFPNGVSYSDIRENVFLIPASALIEHLDGLNGSTFVFAGLNDECLRILLTDDRIPTHSVILLTQKAGQFLKATLRPLVEDMQEFKSFKPRMESILRNLKDLPDDASVLTGGDYALPAFRVELSSDAASSDHEVDPEAWQIRYESGALHYRRETSDAYVYDPASHHASEAGFRSAQVKSLEVGDKVFVMSAELREMVEQALREAGIPIQSDKTYEAALRSYHAEVKDRLVSRFPDSSISERVRSIRAEMLSINPKLERELPIEHSMRLWIDLEKSQETPFEELRPQAPLKEAVFKAFAIVLGFSSLEAAYHWQRVIMAVRNSRRLDGRHVSDIYEHMLLQPESAMANSNIRRSTLGLLFEKARESVATVAYVGPQMEVGK